jgi:succinoglycan biosynthesis transport protein ExoP
MKSTMRAPVDSKAVFVSLRCYERLLAVYPERHRREYGFPMAQLFRDQCRGAWRESRSWGLVTLWLRVLPDLVKTLVLEHLATMKGRKSMVEKISEITNVNTAPLRTFFSVFIVVFLLVFGASAIITFLLPESFRSTVRVKVERSPSPSAGQNGSPATSSGYDPYFVQTEFEVIQSQVVLSKVIETLDLNAKWGKRYAGGAKLKTQETMTLLKGRLDLRPVRNTSLVEISVYGEDRDEPALIANAIAEAYREHRLNQQLSLANQNIQVLKKQFDEQEQKVREGQRQVDRLRKDLNISDLDAMGNTPAPTLEADTVRQLKAQLIASEAQLDREENQLKELQKLTPDQRRNTLQTVVGTDDMFSKLVNEQNSAEQKLVSLRNEFATDHPTYQTARLLSEDAAKRVGERVDGVMLGLSMRINTIRFTVNNLKDKLDKAREMDIKLSERSRPYYEAKRRLEELTRFQTLLNLKMASEKIDMSLPKSTLVEIIDRAEPGLRPVRPNKALNLFVGAIVGTLLGAVAGGAVAWGRSRVRPKTPSHATAA